MGRKSQLPDGARKFIADSYAVHEGLGSAAYASLLNSDPKYRTELNRLGAMQITPGMVKAAVPRFKKIIEDSRQRCKEHGSGQEGRPAGHMSGMRRSYDSLAELADHLGTIWYGTIERAKDYSGQMLKIDEAAARMGGAVKRYRQTRDAEDAITGIRLQISDLCGSIEKAQAEMKALDPSKDAGLARSVYDNLMVIRRMHSVIERSAMPEANKEILESGVRSKLSAIDKMGNGVEIAAAAKDALETAQSLISRAGTRRAKVRTVKERLLADDRAFITQTITMMHGDGADPTEAAIRERATGLGYPTAGFNYALDVLEKEGAVHRMFDGTGSAVYLLKEQQPHGQLRDRPISTEERIAAAEAKRREGLAKGTPEVRIPAPQGPMCEVKVERDHVMINGKGISKEYLETRLRAARPQGYLSLQPNDITRHSGVELDREECRALGEWAAKEMGLGGAGNEYSMTLSGDSIEIRKRTGRDKVQAMTRKEENEDAEMRREKRE